jgi:cyanophycinase
MPTTSVRSTLPAGLLVAALLWGACPARAESGLFAEAAMGPLVIVGGRLDPANEPIYRAILGLRLPDGPICVVPTANAEPGHSVDSYIAAFERYGGPGAAVAAPDLHARPDRADRPKIARMLEGCGGFFFTGGDGSRVVETLRPGGRATLALQAILDVHRRGGIVAGSSAGAAIMTDSMIGAGTSDDALLHGIDAAGVEVGAGMGLFRGAIADQHHMARGRTGRLVVALASLPGIRWGFGIDEDTALVVRGTQATIVGASQVVILEKLTAGTGPNHLDGSHFRVLLLGNNDAFDLMDGTAAVDGRKEVLRLPGVRPAPPTGPWVATGLPLFLVDLAVSDAETAAFTSNGYRFRLTKESPFQARAWEVPDGRNVPHGFSAGWFRLDIDRVE